MRPAKGPAGDKGWVGSMGITLTAAGLATEVLITYFIETYDAWHFDLGNSYGASAAFLH